MAIYLWPDPAAPSGKSLLIRAAFGNGLAIDPACCCEDCHCDLLPDTLYAKIEHTVNVDGGGVATRTTYFTLQQTATPDGCACPLAADTPPHSKAWHGIVKRGVWAFVVDHYELQEWDVHLIMNCGSGGLSDKLGLTVSGDMYFLEGSSGVCNAGSVIEVDCPLEYPIHLDPEVVNITDMWISDVPWS